jgi:drug/metabolite transporter (DMT)-like permease
MQARPMKPPGRAVAAAVAGALCISTSAIVMRLAGSSASTTALGRSGFALPVLALLVFLERRRQLRRRAADVASADGAATAGGAGAARAMSVRGRRTARLAGVFLAGDLVLWAHSITDIGAGLSTVLSNLQVVVVPLLAWALLGERPRRSLAVAGPVMLLGLILVGGVVTGGGYGADPGLGAVYGVGVALLYSGYILLLRRAAGGAGGTAGYALAVETLFQATLGAVIGSLVLGLALRDFRLGPWPALGWLIVLAMTSGVLGWLLITISLPRLPAWLASSLLLVQPAGSLALGAVIFGERPSAVQSAGVAALLGGVLIAARGKERTSSEKVTPFYRHNSDVGRALPPASPETAP